MNNHDVRIAEHAQVFNQKHQSSRIMFEYKLSVDLQEDGLLSAERLWQGITTEPYLAKERVLWCPKQGLKLVEMHQPHLEESASLLISAKQGRSVLKSLKTDYQQKSKTLNFSKRPCTLLSLPFEIIYHWEELVAGKTLYFDYTVLKVQAHTGVSVKMSSEGQYQVVSVTPEKWFWRLLFGSTKFYFESDTSKLTKIVGLLEPRDRNLRGKYVEYLGPAIFDNPIDLLAIQEGYYE